MATTLIPDCPPLDPSKDLKRLLRDAYEAYTSHMADMDKTTDPEDHLYYSGSADAYRSMIMWMTGVDLLESDL